MKLRRGTETKGGCVRSEGSARDAKAPPGKWPSLVAKGAAMGVAEVVPGVSGGTVAFVTGIYEPLVKSLASFSRFRPALLFKDWRAFAREHDLGFLAVLGVGMVVGFAAFAQIVLWLLDTQGGYVFGLFFGLIAGAALYVGAQSHWRWICTIGVVGLALGLGVGLMFGTPAQNATPSSGLIFLAGALAATAWILPGVSGSFVLLMLGLYQPLLLALKMFELATVATFLAGVAIGLLAFSNLLAWLLERWRTQVLALLTGILAGSLTQVWPWRHAGNDEPLVAGVLASMLLGVSVVVALALASRRRA